MRSGRVRHAWGLCGAVVALFLALCWPPAQAGLKTLRIGTGDWAPYVEQGRADAGALARLVRAVFAESGYAVESVFYPWDRNVLMLQRGALHAIMPYNSSPSRLDYGVCSDPLVRGEVVFFHHRDLAFDCSAFDIVLKKLRVAFELRDDDLQAILQAADLPMTKSELSALFRAPEHKHYRECGDQVLRNFLRGLTIRERGKRD